MMSLVTNLTFLVLSCFGVIPAVSHSWNCSEPVGFCILFSQERHSWQDASVDCFRRNGGLGSLSDIQNVEIPIEMPTEFWSGLAWIHGRLQWMTYEPQEETDLTKISQYASTRHDSSKLCYYYKEQNRALVSELCDKQLYYLCVKPLGSQSTEDFEMISSEIPDFDMMPSLKPRGYVTVYRPFITVDLSTDIPFQLSCNASYATTTYCSKTRVRWLKNGAYQGYDNHDWDITNSVVENRRQWILNWLGKVSCEIFCFSTGKSYRSDEWIVVVPDMVALRMEYHILSTSIDLTLIEENFRNSLKLNQFVHKGVSELHLDFKPFLIHSQVSTSVFSFFAYIVNLNPEQSIRLVTNLQKSVQEPNYWLNRSLSSRNSSQFQNVQVFLLNYCLEKSGNPGLVLVNQPTFARGLNARLHDKMLKDSICHRASEQCEADWYNPPKWVDRKYPLGCKRCMAHFREHNERCFKIIRPQPFSKTIAQCLTEYQLDQVDPLWNLSDWIQLSFDWIEKLPQSNEGDEINSLTQLWLPMQRRTHLGPLQPIWPWNFKAHQELKKNSWGEELKSMAYQTKLSIDWSQLNASQSCLTLDIKTKTLRSAPCSASLSMICVRPRLKPNSVADSHAIPGQCPPDWKTSRLIPERNYCYKLFRDETMSVTFDQAETQCQNYGGHLAIASNPSTLAVIHDIIRTHKRGSFWIGLRYVGGKFVWMDQSIFTYEDLIQFLKTFERDNTTYYGISMDSKDVFTVAVNKSHDIVLQRAHKDTPLKGFMCQTKVIPQRETTLRMTLNQFFQPVVSIHPVQSHFKPLINLSDSDYHPELHSTMNQSLTLSNVSCFFAKQTFTSFYQSNNASINYKIVMGENNFTQWRAAETSCETWDTWSGENLRAKWIMPGNSKDTRLTSFILWFRHRSDFYSSERHDATFQESDGHRAAVNQLFNRYLIPELVKHSAGKAMIQGEDPVSFQSEPHPRNSLLIKYQLVYLLNQSDSVGRPSDSRLEASFSELDDVAILHKIYSFFTKSFESSYFSQFDSVIVRSTEWCAREVTNMNGKFLRLSSENTLNYLEENELLWPKMTEGYLAESTPICITHEGSILRRRCLGDRSSGLYWESLNRYQIVDGGLLCTNTTTLYQKLNATSAMTNTSEILQTIRQNIEGWNPNTAELEILSQSLSKSVDSRGELNGQDLVHLEIIVKQIEELETEKLIQAQQSSAFSSNLAEAIEKLFASVESTENNELLEDGARVQFELAKPYVAATSIDRLIGDDEIVGFVVKTNETNTLQSSVLSSYDNEINGSYVVVFLPSYQSEQNSSAGTIAKERVTFTAFRNTRLVDAAAASGHFSSAVFMSDPSQPGTWIQSDVPYTENGAMVQVQLNPSPPKLTKPVTLYFQSIFITTEENRNLIRCVYWEKQINLGRGGWSTDGCWYGGTVDGLEACQCNHMSTFTLLVGHSENQLQSTVHGEILNVITIIGSVISIIGLFFIVATFSLSPSWRKSIGHKLLVQLSVALIILLLTFILGVDVVSNIHACRTAGIVLHYFLLASFCWMTVEAYHQYLRFVKVFDSYVPRFVLKASLFAWSFPLIPVSIVAIYDIDSYTKNGKVCWLESMPFYLSVLLPLVLLLFFNMIILILVSKSILASGRGLRSNQKQSRQSKDKLLGCFANVVLLGLSWTFGFFSVGPTSSAILFSYFFCSTTTLQGFFLFILYVARDKNARRAWLQLLCFGKANVKSKSKQSQPSTSGLSRQEPDTELSTFRSNPASSSEFASVSPEVTPNSEATSSIPL